MTAKTTVNAPHHCMKEKNSTPSSIENNEAKTGSILKINAVSDGDNFF